MEKLAALCFLCASYLGNEYPEELDRLFLENPDDDFLLELENLGKDYESALALLKEKIIDRSLFEKELFKALGEFYESEEISLRAFAIRCNDLVLGGIADYIEGAHCMSDAYRTFCWISDAVEGIMSADDVERITEAKTAEIKRNFEELFNRYKE